jgi:hypothetical protein
MRKYVKPILWVAAAAGAVLAFFAILVLLAPLLINLEPARERVVTDISQAIGGRLDAQRIDLHLFPRPCFTLRTGSISVPEVISGTFDSLSIYPEINMVLRGKVRIAQLIVERLDMQMTLPEDLYKIGGLKQFSLKAIDDGLAFVVAKVAPKAPGLLLSIKKGSLALLERNRSAFLFSDVDARASLHGKRLKIAVTSNSNVWKVASFAGWVKAGDFEGEGRLQVTQLRPDLIAQNLLPALEPRIEDSEMNLSLSFGASGVKVVHAELQSDVSSATLRKGRQILTLKKVGLKATLHERGDNTVVSFALLDGTHPQPAMSGKVSADQSSSQTRLELFANEVDVESVRGPVLFLAGQIPLVQSVFEILKKGRVSGLKLTSRGSTIHDLAKKENVVVRGSITGGSIFLREPRLDLEEVKGIAVISAGILEGENLEARLGNARGTKGLLRLEFKGEHTRFHLDIAVRADVAELPFYLKGLVEDQAFLTELDLIKEVQGDASGRLILDQRASGTQISVEVQAFSLHALYQRFPYPLEISGKFSYDGPTATITVGGVSGKVGRSTLSHLSGQLKLEKEPHLAVTSAVSTIALDEIYPWLLSFESVKESLERLDSVKGTVKLDALHADGPAARPAIWQFQAKGHVENIAVAVRGFPGTVEVKRGNFEAGPEQLSLSSVETRLQDSSLTISGVLSHYLKDLDRVDMSLTGEIGKESTARLPDFIDLPQRLKIHLPFSLSRAHVFWEKSGKTLFSGNLSVKHGPEVFVDASYAAEELTIKQLAIRDAKSNASLSFHRKGREFDLTFKGNLAGATLDELFERNEFLKGWIKGDLSTRIALDQPFNSVAQGTLQGAGLNYPWGGEGPIQVATFSLNAQGNLFTVESNLLLLGHTLRTKGKVDFLLDGFVFDMDVFTNGFELDQIMTKVGGKEGDEAFWPLPLKGILRVESDYVKYGRFTWRPVHTNITIEPQRISIEIAKANLCAIDTPGLLVLSSKGLEVSIKPKATNQDLRDTFACLLDIKDVSGRFSFNGEASGKGKAEALVGSLKGTMEFEAKNGRIDRYGLLAKIFQVLSPTGILRIPDLTKEGFPYYTIKANGNLQDGKITVKEALVDSAATDLVFNGEIDLIGRKVDVVVLVVPFRTIDRIINFIPLVRYVMAGRLIAIPVRIAGDIENPEVTPFPPSAIGAGLLDTVKRIFHLPFKIIQPLLAL